MGQMHVECWDFARAPRDVWRLRYRPYDRLADHDRRELVEAVDRVSSHWMAVDGDGHVLAALRSTEASQGGLWHPFAPIIKTMDADEMVASLIVSRLAHDGTAAGPHALEELFFSFCQSHRHSRHHHCFVQISPDLRLFFNQFVLETLRQPCPDVIAGPQIVIKFDMRRSTPTSGHQRHDLALATTP